MQLRSYRTALCALLLLAASFTAATAQQPRANRPVSAIPTNVLLPIMRAEDERRWDKDLASLLTDKSAQVRKRAALAAGRIGDERAVPALAELLRKDREDDVRQMAAFALGEIESSLSADALNEVLDDIKQPGEVRARAAEALGKIAAALPPAEEARRLSIGKVILNALAGERKEGAMTESGVRNRELELLGLTAVLRSRPADAGKVVVVFLSSPDPRIRADAANTLARLRAKDGVDALRMLLVDDQSPIVRANAARALGAAEDKQAFDALLVRALNDYDLRVRVSAIRALGSLKDERAAQPLLERASKLAESLRGDRITIIRMQNGKPPSQQNEWLEIFATIGNVLFGKKDANFQPLALREPPAEFQAWNRKQIFREEEISNAKLGPEEYLDDTEVNPFKRKAKAYPREFFSDWRRAASVAQGVAVIATLGPVAENKDLPKLQAEAQRVLRAMLEDTRLSVIALPDVLTAYASFKSQDVSETVRPYLKNGDVIVRSTAAELLGSQPPDEANTRALVAALPRALRDKDLNDAALAILDALAKQKGKEANNAIKTALDSSDHLIRRRAVALLKANGAGDFTNRIGTVQTRNSEADYRRAIARIGKHVTATVVTSKGSFTIEFLPEDAPLTVDNFIRLARKGFFNGQTIPRVVPNFVIQAGDPRGDTNGGPGYQIRCEINEVPYERAAVGMALSGKDTGGSQWFVTHAPQPHLDGGYTVFGRVIRGMDVVDRIARGDTIRRVVVNEKN